MSDLVYTLDCLNDIHDITLICSYQIEKIKNEDCFYISKVIIYVDTVYVEQEFIYKEKIFEFIFINDEKNKINSKFPDLPTFEKIINSNSFFVYSPPLIKNLKNFDAEDMLQSKLTIKDKSGNILNVAETDKWNFHINEINYLNMTSEQKNNYIFENRIFLTIKERILKSIIYLRLPNDNFISLWPKKINIKNNKIYIICE